jgi:hypothetical protein
MRGKTPHVRGWRSVRGADSAAAFIAVGSHHFGMAQFVKK